MIIAHKLFIRIEVLTNEFVPQLVFISLTDSKCKILIQTMISFANLRFSHYDYGQNNTIETVKNY